MTDRSPRIATIEEVRALGHPARWRILRLCLDDAYTNQQLAERLNLAPATVLRHVRALVDVGFLVPEPVRTGDRGALERPYRATGGTWGLCFSVGPEPDLVQQVDVAILDAHRAEVLEAGPESGRDLRRGVLRLDRGAQEELADRMTALIEEFAGRATPDGEPLSYLWSVAARPSGDTAEPKPEPQGDPAEEPKADNSD